MENFLVDFYVKGICPGRTVSLQRNVYTSLLQVADTCVSTRYAILSLSASYLCEQLPKEKDAYHQAELYYSTQALQALASQIRDGSNYDGAMATSMLLMHHDLINQEESSLCWSCHANVLDAIPPGVIDPQSDPVLFLRTQLILARTAQTFNQLSNVRRHVFETTNWLEGVFQSLDYSGSLGSVAFLHIIYNITSDESKQTEQAYVRPTTGDRTPEPEPLESGAGGARERSINCHRRGFPSRRGHLSALSRLRVGSPKSLS